MLDRKNYESAIPQLEKKIDEIESGQKESVINYDAFREKTEKELKVVRSGIVDNNALIIEERERAIGVEETKADQTDLDDLSETVDQKADEDSVYDKSTTDDFIDMLWANGTNILDGSEHILWDTVREVFLAPYSTSTATAGNSFRDGERLFYTSGGQDKYIIIDFPTLQEGRKYTLSMSVAKATSSTGSHTAYLIIDGTSYSFSGITSESWVDISATFTATSSSTFAKMRFGSASNTSDQATFIKHIKLEQGEDSTDWTPSQLDASKMASNYIRYDEQNGLYVTDDTDTLENAVRIDSDSVDIVKGGSTVATFSDRLIELGKNLVTSVIRMCNGRFYMSARISTDPEGGEQWASHWIGVNRTPSDDYWTIGLTTLPETEGSLDNAYASVRCDDWHYAGHSNPTVYLVADDGKNNRARLEVGSFYIDLNADVIDFNGSLVRINDVEMPQISHDISDNSWIYTKYTDGTFEAWRTYVTGSTALTNEANGAYSYANWSSISAPALNSDGTTSRPTHVKATCRNGGRFASAYTSGTNVLFKVYACASVSTAQTYTVDLHIRGTWS